MHYQWMRYTLRLVILKLIIQRRTLKFISSYLKGKRGILYIGVVVAILTVVIGAVQAMLHLRQQDEMQAQLTTQNLVKSVEQTLDGMIDTIDVALLTSADEIGRRTSLSKTDVMTNTRYLDLQLKRLPHMAYLRATNARGVVIYGSGVMSPPNNISDREYFLLLRDGQQNDVLLSRHLVGRIAGKWAWLFVRRINKPDGTFAGVVFAGILAEQIEAHFSQIKLDSGASIVLRDADMGLIARYSPASTSAIAYGNKQLSAPFTDSLRINKAEGTYVSGATSIDNISRIHSYRRGSKYGFTINVGIATETAFADWFKQLWFVVALVTFFVLASLLFVWMINRAWRRQEEDMVTLADSQRFIKAIADHLPGMVAYWDRNLRCRFANLPYLEWFGKQPEAMIGITMQELMGESLFALNEAFIRKVLAGERQNFERTLTKANGSIGYTWANYIPDVNGEGIVTGFFVMVTDVTPLKLAEKENEEMRRNQLALLDAIQESAFMMERSGTIQVINELGAKRLNSTPEVLTGKNVYEILPPELAQQRRAIFEHIARTGIHETMEDMREGRRFLSVIYPVRDTAGEVTRFAVYAADITQQRQIQTIDELFTTINQKVLQGLPLQDLLQFICSEVAGLFDLCLTWVGRKEPDGSVNIVSYTGSAAGYVEGLTQRGLRWDDTPQGRGATGMAIRSGQTQLIRPSDPGFKVWRELAEEYSLQSMLVIPLLLRGEVYGAFALYSGKTDTFSAAITEMLLGISTRISVALEAAMNQQQIRLLSSALSEAANGVMITNQNGVIQWVNPAFTKLCGYSKDDLIGQTPRVLKSGQQSKEYYQTLWNTISQGQNWSSETIERAKDGRIYIVSQTITPMLDESGLITHYISIHEDITAQKNTQDRIRYMAHYDALTNLPNRALFYDRMKQAFSMAKRNRGGMALLFLDLDGFKKVNDSLGHHAGDLLLIGVAERLQQCVRESDTIARLGGDEFTIILNEVHEKQSVANVAEKIIALIADPFILDGNEAHIGISIGIALFSENAVSEDQLMNNADLAMYEAKSAGKNTYKFSSN